VVARFHRGEEMSVRKRTWKNAKGEPEEAWIIDCLDQRGDRTQKTFARKKDASRRLARSGMPPPRPTVWSVRPVRNTSGM
jgi:hypothetical protein